MIQIVSVVIYIFIKYTSNFTSNIQYLLVTVEFFITFFFFPLRVDQVFAVRLVQIQDTLCIAVKIQFETGEINCKGSRLSSCSESQKRNRRVWNGSHRSDQLKKKVPNDAKIRDRKEEKEYEIT